MILLILPRRLMTAPFDAADLDAANVNDARRARMARLSAADMAMLGCFTPPEDEERGHWDRLGDAYDRMRDREEEASLG